MAEPSTSIRPPTNGSADAGIHCSALRCARTRLDLARVQCFYGEEEEDTLCRAPELAAAERIGTRGGHHFDGDYAKLAQRILDGALRRSGQRATTPVMPPEISAATSVSTKGTESPLGAAR